MTNKYCGESNRPAGFFHELHSDTDSVPEEDEDQDDDHLQDGQNDDCREKHDIQDEL